jgi:hypothetical protein
VRIGIVGGLGRVEPIFARIAEAAGHEPRFHDGATSASGLRDLASLVENTELVLVLADVNSHGAVRLARRLLRERGRSPVLLRRCGAARFGALLAALGRRDALGALAGP